MSRNLILKIVAGAMVLALVGFGLVINSRFSTAEARRSQARDIVAEANLILSRLPEGFADTQGLITTVMPRNLDAEQLRAVIAATAADFNLEMIDTEVEWDQQLLSGRDTSYGDQIIAELNLSDLRDRNLVEPVSAVISLQGALADINALMTALSQRQSQDADAPELLLRRSDVVLTFTQEVATATFEVIGIRMTALLPELRVLISSEGP